MRTFFKTIRSDRMCDANFILPQIPADAKENGETTALQNKTDESKPTTGSIILDCRGVPFVDVVGIKALRRVN